MKLALRAWPPSPPDPLSPTARHTANERGQMCKRACEAVAPASSPERCQRKPPTHCHKQPRENMDLVITSPLQGIAARRARERHARPPCQITFSRAARAKNFNCLQSEFKHLRAKRGAKFFARSHAKMRAFPPPHGRQRREKRAKKCERFPRPTDASEEKNERNNASVSPAPRTPAKRKTSEKMRALPPAHGRPQAQKHTRARAQSARA